MEMLRLSYQSNMSTKQVLDVHHLLSWADEARDALEGGDATVMLESESTKVYQTIANSRFTMSTRNVNEGET